VIIEVGEVFIHRNQDRERNRKIFVFIITTLVLQTRCVCICTDAHSFTRAREVLFSFLTFVTTADEFGSYECDASQILSIAFSR